jgi:hypothetical protein
MRGTSVSGRAVAYITHRIRGDRAEYGVRVPPLRYARVPPLDGKKSTVVDFNVCGVQ